MFFLLGRVNLPHDAALRGYRPCDLKARRGVFDDGFYEQEPVVSAGCGHSSTTPSHFAASSRSRATCELEAFILGSVVAFKPVSGLESCEHYIMPKAAASRDRCHRQ